MPPIPSMGLTKTDTAGPLAVDHVDLEVRDGEFMVLVGPPGCGKSTLLQMLAGIVEVSEASGATVQLAIDPARLPAFDPGTDAALARDGAPASEHALA